jgi:hypothetical protein
MRYVYNDDECFKKLTQVPAAISSASSNIFSAVVTLNCHIYSGFGEFEANSIAGTKATGRLEIIIDAIIQQVGRRNPCASLSNRPSIVKHGQQIMISPRESDI